MAYKITCSKILGQMIYNNREDTTLTMNFVLSHWKEHQHQMNQSPIC